MMPTLGLIAGGGQFPHTVAQNARVQGHRVVGIGFTSDTDASLPQFCDAFCWLKLGQLNRLIAFFKDQHVHQVTLAGPINKPRALDLRPDWRAARLLFSLREKGDDILLRALCGELEREGFTVMSAQSFVPELQTPPGIFSRRQPTQQELQDIETAWRISAALGPLDIGQCIAVREGIILAVEAIEGTDATILRAGELGGPGAVILKRPKKGQDRRIDLPAVGISTVQSMIRAQASCLVLEADGCLFFDREKALALADQTGIAVLSHPPDS